MDITADIFRHRRVHVERLADAGFSRSASAFTKYLPLPHSGFELHICISTAGQVSTTVMDPVFQEPQTRAAVSLSRPVKQRRVQLVKQVCKPSGSVTARTAEKTILLVSGGSPASKMPPLPPVSLQLSKTAVSVRSSGRFLSALRTTCIKETSIPLTTLLHGKPAQNEALYRLIVFKIDADRLVHGREGHLLLGVNLLHHGNELILVEFAKLTCHKPVKERGFPGVIVNDWNCLRNTRSPPNTPSKCRHKIYPGTQVDGTHFFPAWHMNKKTWYTLLLDGSLPASALAQRLAASRERALR